MFISSWLEQQVRRVRPFVAQEKKHDEYEASVYAASAQHEYHDHSWKPRIWKRLHFISACLLICTIMVFLIEFSYSNTFAYVELESMSYFTIFNYKSRNYTVEIILFLKVLAPAIDYFFEILVQEKLLTAPFMVSRACN